MVHRKYVVKDCQEAPRSSHRSFLFPECTYTLARQDDGKLFKVTLSKSLGWKPEQVLDLEERIVEGPLP